MQHHFKLTAIVLAVAAMLALPGVAQAGWNPCPCTRPWARAFLHDGRAVRHFDRVFARRMVWVPPYLIRRANRALKERLIDWEKVGQLDRPEGFCKRHSRVCKAAIACAKAGTLAAISVRAAGGSPAQANWAFGTACASAAAQVMLYG